MGVPPVTVTASLRLKKPSKVTVSPALRSPFEGDLGQRRYGRRDGIDLRLWLWVRPESEKIGGRWFCAVSDTR